MGLRIVDLEFLKTMTVLSHVGSQVPVAALQVGPDRRWYVAQTLPFREAKAQVQLKRQGFTAFLPRYIKMIRHARRRTAVSAPLFPNYLFVALDLRHDRWRSINGTLGVAHLLTASDRPTPVLAGVVEALVAATRQDGNLSLCDSVALGDRVQIIEGPFADLIGQLVRIDGGGRVQVLLRLLGGSTPVSIDRRVLIPVLPRRFAH
jgi:transcription elongation factor/antiterminator RfaH